MLGLRSVGHRTNGAYLAGPPFLDPQDELVAATKAETNAANSHALAKNARDATLKATEALVAENNTSSNHTQSRPLIRIIIKVVLIRYGYWFSIHH